MPATIKYPDNPNEETAFVTQEDGQRSRAVLTAAVEGTIEYPDNPNSTKVMVTVDGVKRRAVAVANIAGGGGGDQHNLGYYADLTALQTAYPTGADGDFAILGSTDTIWVWDSGTSAWKDTDTKGQVTSVNSQTGDVTITAASISALPTSGGTMTGNIAFEHTGYNDKVIGNHTGYLRIGTSTTPGNDDLLVSTGSGGARSISFGSGNGGQLGSSAAKFERTYTQKLNNGADVAIPTVAGAIALQENTMPTAASGNEGLVVQYIGATDANYTNGYFYKCVSDGQEPATYSWEAVQVQAGGGGASYTAGNGISIDANNEISVTAPTLTNAATGTDSLGVLSSSVSYNNAIAVGKDAYVDGNNSTGIGYNAHTRADSVCVGYQTEASSSGVSIGKWAGSYANNGARSIYIGQSSKGSSSASDAIAIGYWTGATANHAIQLGNISSSSATTNSDANTFKVANANGNFEIMSADGTIPTARFATDPVADGTYVPTVVVSSGVATRSWAAPSGGGVSSISVTLPAADWSGSAQTVTATGVTASNTVIIGAAPASQAEYTTCGVICTAQGTDSLSFTCTSTPTNDLTVTVLILA